MIEITSTAAEHRETALMLLLERTPVAERAQKAAEILQAAETGAVSLEHLLVAHSAGEAVGAGLTVIQPDGTGFVWPPVVRPGLPVQAVSDGILQEINHRLDSAGAWLGQSLIEPGETEDQRAMERNGYRHLADLRFLSRALGEPLPPLPEVPFETIPFEPDFNRDRFADVLQRTYQGTLDCPELNGARTAQQALLGHQGSGVFDPSRWKIYVIDGVEAGLMLWSEHPDQRAWELAYMGTVPQVRGRGFGRLMLLDGLQAARSGGAESVFLAVDSRNSYARDVYRHAGFVDVAVRAVHVRFSRGRASGQ